MLFHVFFLKKSKNIVFAFFSFSPVFISCFFSFVVLLSSLHSGRSKVTRVTVATSTNQPKFSSLLSKSCDLEGRNQSSKLENFGWLVDVATVTRVTFDHPECNELKRTTNEKKHEQKQEKRNEKKRKKKPANMKTWKNFFKFFKKKNKEIQHVKIRNNSTKKTKIENKDKQSKNQKRKGLQGVPPETAQFLKCCKKSCSNRSQKKN